jgi:hypothetical protein
MANVKKMLHLYIGERLTPQVEADIKADFGEVHVVRQGQPLRFSDHHGCAILQVDENDIILNVAIA